MSVTQNGRRRAQPRVNRRGAQSPGTFITQKQFDNSIANRNRRYLGLGTVAGGLGMANAITTNNKRSYTGPSSRIVTPKGVGRNA